MDRVEAEAIYAGQVPAVAGSYRDAIVSPDGRFLHLLMSGGVVGFRLG